MMEQIDTNNLTLYIRMQLRGALVNYTTSAYTRNGYLQYYSEDQQNFPDVSGALSVFPYLSFT